VHCSILNYSLLYVHNISLLTFSGEHGEKKKANKKLSNKIVGSEPSALMRYGKNDENDDSGPGARDTKGMTHAERPVGRILNRTTKGSSNSVEKTSARKEKSSSSKRIVLAAINSNIASDVDIYPPFNSYNLHRFQQIQNKQMIF
jgi:hypothetical protein